jgi:peptide/nickel transport system ATP-binding protein
MMPIGSDIVLHVSGLRKYFPIIEQGILQRTIGQVKAVDDVSFELRRGETLGLVGESGCGKTTVGRCIARAYDPTGGQILYRRQDGSVTDLCLLSNRQLKPLHREVRMIFQDPFSSLNPRMTVLDIVSDPLKVHGICKGKQMEDRVAYLMEQVGLPSEYMRRYPHAFSGGQRQRIGIARALALDPQLIIADEAVSALDVSVRAQILNLLLDLHDAFGLTYLFISHDLSVVEYIADRVAVMYVGRLVELARTADLYGTPKHPYTEALLSAVPAPDPSRRAQGIILEGEVADPARPPSGCYFHPRCRYAQERCKSEAPALHSVGEDHLVACHFAAELRLAGIVR